MLTIFIFLISYIFSQDVVYDIEKTEFVSEYAFYDSSKTIINIATNAIINIFDKNDNVVLKLKTDYADINLSSSTIEFSSFTIETSSIYIQGTGGDYNLESASGKLFSIYSHYDRFILKSKFSEIYRNKQIYRHAYITTCSQPKPHYRISSSKITLSPGRYFLSYNNVFYIGDIPILYLPILYKPLGEGTPVISQFYPGFDERNGFYIKSNYTYKLSRYHKIRAYLDYYSKKGFGTGGEFFGHNSDIFKYNFSYYRINEYGKNPIYWGMNGGIWYNLFSNNVRSFYLQSFARLPSDPGFNNNYFRSNPFIISPTRQWDVSFTYKLPLSYLRIKTSVLYSSSNNIYFFKHEEMMPKFEYQMLTRKISFLPLSHSFYFSLENTRYDETYFQKHSKLNYIIYVSIPFSRNLNGYTSLGTEFTTSFSTSSTNSNISITRYLINSSMRYSFSTGSVELLYNAILRSDINKFMINKNSLDRGVETSRLSSKLWVVRGISEYFSFETGYDLKDYDYKLSFSKRLFPISFEYYSFFSNYELYFKEIYNINYGHKVFITNMTTNMEKNYLTVGFANYDTQRERFLISTTLGYNPIPNKGWHGEFGIRYYIDFSKDMSLKFYEKNFIINKEFHDFNTRFVFRNRKNNNEFFFYITMKMNDPYRKDKIDSEIDKEFRPWRKFSEERDY